MLGFMVQPALTQWYSSIHSIKADTLTIASVIRGDLLRDVAVSGKAVAARAPQLYSTEQGQITLLVKPGEAVSQNQIVASLESPELQATLEQQESTLEQLTISASRGELEDKEAQLALERDMNTAQSKLNVAVREMQRAEIAYKKKIISEVDWMKSQDVLADAEQDFKHAKMRVELAKARLKFESQHRQFLVQKQQLIVNELKRRRQALDIKAPIGGIVGNWLVDQKNSISANTAIMTIVDLSEYEAELSVPEFYADELGLGLVVSMKINGIDVKGDIISISPEIKGNQVAVRARIMSENLTQLRQNQRINARIEFEKKHDVLMIKRGAFLGEFAGEFAFKKVDDNTAQKIAIATGNSSVDFIELLSGVNEGDQLIVSDYQQFIDAEHINITN